jgi:hypothetical protein
VPSLRKSAETCLRTVTVAIPRAAAISDVDIPFGSSCATSRSRAVSCTSRPSASVDLDYEVALIAVADCAAASLAAGRTDARDPAVLATAIAEECGAGAAAVSLALLTRIAMSPKLVQLPTERAVELQLGTLASLAGLTRVSLWSSVLGRVTCRFSLGRGAGGAVERAVVERRLGAGGAAASPAEDRLVSAMVLRVDTPVAVVVGTRTHSVTSMTAASSSA